MDANRRYFLKASALSLGGFALSFSSLSNDWLTEKSNDSTEIIQGVEVSESGKVIIRVLKQEMGQGIATGLAMAVAEEMDVNWNDVTVKQLRYNASMLPSKTMHRYDTGGSFGMSAEFLPMRILGATAKGMFMRAAALQWNIDPKDCICSSSRVSNTVNNKTLSYGQLASLAALQEIIEVQELKSPDKFKILGSELPSDKCSQVISGQIKYSMDLKFPKMLYSMIVRPPSLGGTLIKYDDSEAKKLDGVVDIFTLAPVISESLFFKGVRGGVVIVAESTWACMQARKVLTVQWNKLDSMKRNSDDMYQELDKFRQEGTGKTNFKAGNVKKGMQASSKVISAEYTSPYIAHGLMESLNAVAEFAEDGSVSIWVGTQSPNATAKNISNVLGIDRKQITINPLPMGGGYGRRYFADYVIEAVLVAKRYSQPVKLIWTREDEIQFDSVHPLRKDYCQCGLDEIGNVKSFAIDAVSTHEWGGMGLPWFYGHQDLLFRSWFYDNKLLQWGSWRAVVMHLDVYSRECFLDEVAYEAGVDPLEYRIQQTKLPQPIGTSEQDQKNNHRITELKRHHLRSFEAIKKLSRWDEKRPDNVGLGVATVAYHDVSLCTQVAEVSVTKGKIKVDKIYCVADVGFCVNPNLVKGQIESSILWGMTPVLHGGVDVVQGEIIQSNFDSMPLAKIQEAPEIIIQLENYEDRKPSGAGEFAVPPIAPAILNAVYAVTGERIRTMKLPKHMIA